MYRILEYDQQKDIQEEYDMPALSMFYGIIVRMQSEKGGKHNKPHIHANQDIYCPISGQDKD